MFCKSEYKVRVANYFFSLIHFQKQQFSIKIAFCHAVCEQRLQYTCIQNTDDKVPINAGKIVKIHRFYGFGWPVTVRLKT